MDIFILYRDKCENLNIRKKDFHIVIFDLKSDHSRGKESKNMATNINFTYQYHLQKKNVWLCN